MKPIPERRLKGDRKGRKIEPLELPKADLKAPRASVPDIDKPELLKKPVKRQSFASALAVDNAGP